MKLTLETAPSLYPINLDDAKDHRRITHTDDDDYIQGLIYTAVTMAENFTCRRFLTQTWKMWLDGWPKKAIRLPFGQLQSVDSIVYTDSDESDTTWSSAEYVEETDDPDNGRIVLGYGETWPSFTASVSNPICITFTCGWTAAKDVPPAIKQALKIQVADMYQNRETYATSNIKPLPTVENLLLTEKLYGVYP